MPTNKANTSNPLENIKQFLVPSWARGILYLLISIFVLTLLKAQTAWHRFKDSSLLGNVGHQEQNSTAVHNAWNTFVQGRAPQILFWMAVGVGVYTIVWFMWSIVANIRNDIIADEYVHPKTYNRRRYWQSVLVRKVFFVCSILVLVVYMVTFLNLFALIANLSYTAIIDFDLQSSLITISGSVITGALLTHILVVLVHITANSWQTINKDL